VGRIEPQVHRYLILADAAAERHPTVKLWRMRLLRRFNWEGWCQRIFRDGIDQRLLIALGLVLVTLALFAAE
jgi:hypothetical protein